MYDFLRADLCSYASPQGYSMPSRYTQAVHRLVASTVSLFFARDDKIWEKSFFVPFPDLSSDVGRIASSDSRSFTNTSGNFHAAGAAFFEVKVDSRT